MSDQRDMQAVIQAAREAGEPSDLDVTKPQAVIVPQGSILAIPDLREWRSAPEREQGEYHVKDVDSFIAYIDQHGYTQVASVWVDPRSASAMGVLNDHDAEGPGWSDWRVTLGLDATPEWKYWTGQDGKLMSQIEFAQHIEDGLIDIEEPPGAVLLEMVQSFHATNSASFRSATRLQSGEQQFAYEENIEARAGRTGQLEIPTQILLNIAPFVGEEGVLLNARFRYRLQGGKLSLSYKLERPEQVRLAAIERVYERLKEKFPRTYLGVPRTVHYAPVHHSIGTTGASV